VVRPPCHAYVRAEALGRQNNPGQAGMAFRREGEAPGMDGTITVPPSATSPGLLLRPWTELDIPAMVAAHRDPAMRHWLRHPVTTTEEVRRMIEGTMRGGNFAGGPIFIAPNGIGAVFSPTGVFQYFRSCLTHDNPSRRSQPSSP
jgi:hypothetical protein